MSRLLAILLLIGSLCFPVHDVAAQVATGDVPAAKQMATAVNVGAASAKIITGVANTTFSIAALFLSNTNSTATAVSLIEGTGTNCGTGTLAVLGNATGSIEVAGTSSVAIHEPRVFVRTAVAGNDLCIISTAAGSINVTVLYNENHN